MGHIPEGTASDVDRAVAAAKAAAPDLGLHPKEERGKYLQRLPRASPPGPPRSARSSARKWACPLMWANMIQAACRGNAANYVEILENYEFEEEIGNSLVVKEPVGVVGAITPWNYPSTRSSARSPRPSPPAGTVVLKPSEVAR